MWYGAQKWAWVWSLKINVFRVYFLSYKEASHISPAETCGSSQKMNFHALSWIKWNELKTYKPFSKLSCIWMEKHKLILKTCLEPDCGASYFYVWFWMWSEPTITMVLPTQGKSIRKFQQWSPESCNMAVLSEPHVGLLDWTRVWTGPWREWKQVPPTRDL